MSWKSIGLQYKGGSDFSLVLIIVCRQYDHIILVCLSIFTGSIFNFIKSVT